MIISVSFESNMIPLQLILRLPHSAQIKQTPDAQRRRASLSKRGSDNWRTSLCSDGGIDRARRADSNTWFHYCPSGTHLNIIGMLWTYKQKGGKFQSVDTVHNHVSNLQVLALKSSSVFLCKHDFVGVYMCMPLHMYACSRLFVCKGECLLKFKVGFLSCLFPLAHSAPCRSACTLHTLCSLIHQFHSHPTIKHHHLAWKQLLKLVCNFTFFGGKEGRCTACQMPYRCIKYSFHIFLI